MRAGSIVLLAGLATSRPATSQPLPHASAPAARTRLEIAPIRFVSASYAEARRTPVAETEPKPAAIPAKRPIARVTTCRCGDPQASAELAEQ